MNIPTYKLSKDRQKLVYICGPITDIPNLNAEAFKDVEQKLKEMGYMPVVPHDLFVDVDDKSLEHHHYMEGCISALALCPTVVLLQGWENSKGCNIEVGTARLMGKKVVPVWTMIKDTPIENLNEEFKGY